MKINKCLKLVKNNESVASYRYPGMSAIRLHTCLIIISLLCDQLYLLHSNPVL